MGASAVRAMTLKVRSHHQSTDTVDPLQPFVSCIRKASGRSQAVTITRPRTSLIGLDDVYVEVIEVLACSAKIGRINAPAIHAIKGANDH